MRKKWRKCISLVCAVSMLTVTSRIGNLGFQINAQAVQVTEAGQGEDSGSTEAGQGEDSGSTEAGQSEDSDSMETGQDKDSGNTAENYKKMRETSLTDRVKRQQLQCCFLSLLGLQSFSGKNTEETEQLEIIIKIKEH